MNNLINEARHSPINDETILSPFQRSTESRQWPYRPKVKADLENSDPLSLEHN